MDSLFTKLQIGVANKRSEAFALSIRAAIKAKAERQCIIPNFPLIIPAIENTRKGSIVFDEKYLLEALPHN